MFEVVMVTIQDLHNCFSYTPNLCLNARIIKIALSSNIQSLISSF